MKRICILTILAVALALISAFAIAQAPTAQPSQSTPAQPQSQAPAQPQTTPAQPAPAEQQPAQAGQPSQSGQQSLSSPSLQAVPAPQGCSKAEKDRIRMRESCGYVLDASGKPVPNASLELVESGQQNAYLFVFSRAITDANGRFDFGPVPSGHYLLRSSQNAPITVYNFVALDTQNANGKCTKPVEVKAATSGSCNSEVHSGQGGFSLSGLLKRNKGEPKGDQKKP